MCEKLFIEECPAFEGLDHGEICLGCEFEMELTELINSIEGE